MPGYEKGLEASETVVQAQIYLLTYLVTNYLRQGGYVMPSRLFVCLSVCLLATLRKNY